MVYCTIEEGSDIYVERREIWYTMVSIREGLGLLPEFDGKVFSDYTVRDCLDRVIVLKEVGYKVSQQAIDKLIREGGCLKITSVLSLQ